MCGISLMGLWDLIGMLDRFKFLYNVITKAFQWEREEKDRRPEKKHLFTGFAKRISSPCDWSWESIQDTEREEKECVYLYC